MKNRILIVDQEKLMVDNLTSNLIGEGFEVCSATNLDEAYFAAVRFKPDLVIFDLKAADRFSLLRKLRANRETQCACLLMLTDCVDEESVLLGFERGVDDYALKPIAVTHLIHRAKILLRRRQSTLGPAIEVVRWFNLELEFRTRIACLNGNNIELTHTEFLLLWALLRKPGQAFARRDLLNQARGMDCLAEERTVDVHIRSLRLKLAEQGRLIETVRSTGYRVHPDESADSSTAESDVLTVADSVKLVGSNSGSRRYREDAQSDTAQLLYQTYPTQSSSDGDASRAKLFHRRAR